MQFQYSTAGVRDNNEDSVCVGANYLAVADGMGGHDCGELASAALIDVWGSSVVDDSDFDIVSKLFKSDCQTLVANIAGRNSGTTFTGAVIEGRILRVLHCGDSAMFLFRRQHGVEDCYDVYRLTNEQNIWGARRRVEPQTSKRGKNSLVSCVMGSRSYEPPMWETPVIDVKVGDIVMAATDGFIGAYEDETGELRLYQMLQEIIECGSDVDSLCDLVERAAVESQDNATLAFIKIEE